MIQDKVTKAIFDFAMTGLKPKIVLLNTKHYEEFCGSINMFSKGPESDTAYYNATYSIGPYTVKLIETDVKQIEVYGN